MSFGCTTDCRRPAGQQCHCTGCHRTFRNPTGFDAHWQGRGENRECVNPVTVGLVEDGALWATPEGHVSARERAARIADSRARAGKTRDAAA